MKEVVVLGASGGIGTAVVKALAGTEVRFWLHYNRGSEAKDKLSTWLDERHVKYKWIQADFKDREAASEFFLTIDKYADGIDVFINAIGTSKHELFQWLSQSEWERLRTVNLDAFIYTAQEAVNRMFGRQGANIVLVSSVWGQVGSAMEVHYSVVKAGVIGLIKALSKELGPSGIRVNGVAPGWIDTEMNAGFTAEERQSFEEELPLGRIGKVEEVANCVSFLSSDSASYLTGQILNPNGGLYI